MVLRYAASLALLLILTVPHALAQDAELVYYWNFNDPAAGSNPYPQPIPADAGDGNITYNFSTGITNFAGSTVNAQGGDPAGQALSIQAGDGLVNNGRYFQLNVSTQGYEDIELAYATRGTAAGFNSRTVEFSVDGGNTWTLVGEDTGTSTNFYLVEYDLSAHPQVNGAPNLMLRFTLDGASAGNGNNRFDNITVSGTFVGGGGGTGTGTVAVDPDFLQGGQGHDLAFTVSARSNEPEDMLTHVDFTLPEGWGPVDASDISLGPGSMATITVDGQTVRISGLEITQSDPQLILVEDLFVADNSGQFGFSFRTGAGTDQTVVIANQPSVLVYGSPIPISEAGANDSQGVSTLLGEYVTIQGVVTAADQFATAGGELGPTYLEDATGGFAVFSPTSVSPNVDLGDEVVLFGRVAQFFGLNQLDNTTVLIETVSTGNVVEPEVVTLSQIAGDGVGGVEVYEGRLVRVNGVSVNTPVWNVESGQTGTNYVLTDATGTLEVRINTNVDFVGQPAPSGTFDIVGVVSQFRPSPPYIGGYQILPRFADDIIDDSDAPLITSTAPFEAAASPTSVTITWTTDRPAHSEVRYNSVYTSESGVVIDEEQKLEHSVVLTDLTPANIYELEIRTAAPGDTTTIAGYPVSTTAAPGTTHEIQVYFTGSVDHDYALYTPALSANPLPRLLQLINGANHSLDVMLYSLSGGPGSNIANALIDAHNRGVQVRVIMENSTSGTAPPTSLQNAGVPFITDAFGPINDGQALHHNKVVIVDARGGDPEEIWVMTGSWNPTDPGTSQHKQNVLFIQDGALAIGYQREFEQMWGSKSTTANATLARFGSNKTVVSPSVYWVGDVYTRLLFSPQGFGAYGSTEQHIIRALQTAEQAIDLGLNLITRMPLVDAMHAMFLEGVNVRGAIGETTTTGSVFAQLAAWADVHDHPAGQFGLLHHKYALVDAERHDLNPITITGSHNWSRSANENNDENTLLIYDADVTNQFLQEYVVRYYEAGGEGGFEVSVEQVPGDIVSFSVSPNYPNPFSTNTTFEYHLPVASDVTVRVYNMLGQEVMRVVDAAQPAGAYRVSLDASNLASGVYLYRVEANAGAQRFQESGRMTVVR